MARSTRSNLAATTFSVEKALSDKKKNRLRNLFLKDFKKNYSTQKGITSLVITNPKRSGGATDGDSFGTMFVRWIKVFGNIAVNRAVDDRGPTHFKGAAAPFLLIGFIGSTIFGMAREVIQHWYAEYLNTLSYYVKRHAKLAPDQLVIARTKGNLEAEVAECVKRFTARYNRPLTKDEKDARIKKPLFEGLTLDTPDLPEKIINALKADDDLLALLLPSGDVKKAKTFKSQEQLKKRLLEMIYLFRADQIRQQIDAMKKLRDKELFFNAVEQFDQNCEVLPQDLQHLKVKKIPTFLHLIQTFSDTSFMGVTRTIYGWAQNYSYLYWLAMVGVIIFKGLEAATKSLGVIVSALTIGTVLAAWQGVRWILQKCGLIDPDKTKEQIDQEKEEQRQEHNARLRHLAQSTHEIAMIEILGNDEWENRKKAALEAKVLRKAEKALSPKQKSPHLFADRLKMVRSEEGARLISSFTGSKLEQNIRLGIAVTSAISTYIGFIFLSYLVTGVLGIVLAPLAGVVGWSSAARALTSAAAYVGNNMTALTTTAISGGVIGAIGSLFDYTKTYTEQLKTEEKVVADLSAEYKTTGKSIMEVYSGIQRTKKEYIEAIKTSGKMLSSHELEKIAAFEYTMQQKPHEGKRYLEKFQRYTRFSSVIKKIAEGMYDFITNSQSGVFCARQLFLGPSSVLFTARNLFVGLGLGITAMIPVSIATGGAAAIGFIAVAIVLGLIVGGIGVAKAMLDRRQKHRDISRENLPGEIKTSKKEIQQLAAIAEKHGITLKEFDADKPISDRAEGQSNESIPRLPLTPPRLTSGEQSRVSAFSALTPVGQPTHNRKASSPLRLPGMESPSWEDSPPLTRSNRAASQ